MIKIAEKKKFLSNTNSLERVSRETMSDSRIKCLEHLPDNLPNMSCRYNLKFRFLFNPLRLNAIIIK